MKSTTSIISSILVIIIILILIISLTFLFFSQYQTNTRIQKTLDVLSIAYLNPDENADTLDLSSKTSSASTTNTSRNYDTSTTSKISALEFSNAIAYLTKMQEVSSSNNSTSILALIYAIISSLILTYGAKMLRLGENDKQHLVKEISKKSREDISAVENHVKVTSSMLNAVTAINSATSALQLLLVTLPNKNRVDLERINTSYMSCLSTMDEHLAIVLSIINSCSIPNIDLTDLTCALSLFEHHYDIYKEETLPRYIDDKTAAQKRVENAFNTNAQINRKQASINGANKENVCVS